MKLRDYAKEIGLLDVGCGDSGCIWGNRGGMCTNAGCRCGTQDAFAARLEMRRFWRLATHLADKLDKAESDLVATTAELVACEKERDEAVRAASERMLRLRDIYTRANPWGREELDIADLEPFIQRMREERDRTKEALQQLNETADIGYRAHDIIWKALGKEAK